MNQFPPHAPAPLPVGEARVPLTNRKVGGDEKSLEGHAETTLTSARAVAYSLACAAALIVYCILTK